jgi:hypothetical protein
MSAMAYSFGTRLKITSAFGTTDLIAPDTS